MSELRQLLESCEHWLSCPPTTQSDRDNVQVLLRTVRDAIKGAAVSDEGVQHPDNQCESFGANWRPPPAPWPAQALALTLREYLAGQALAGLVPSFHDWEFQTNAEPGSPLWRQMRRLLINRMAQTARDIADATIAALEEKRE